MTYSELLLLDEWKEKRIQILERDLYTCQNKECNKEISKYTTIKYIWTIEHYMEMNKYSIYEVNYEKTHITFDKKTNYYYKFLTTYDINSTSIYIINYNSEENGMILQYYRAVNSLAELTVLNVHHRFYIKGRKPWEYDNDEALITLCSDCHKEVHRNEKIPVYNDEREFLSNAILCDRCEGSGYIPEFHYHQDGICFNCSGEGVII
jgi:hypothetical protein